MSIDSRAYVVRYHMAGNFCGVLIFVVHLPDLKISIHEN